MTSTALAVVSIQWLLRVRGWEIDGAQYRRKRTATNSEGNSLVSTDDVKTQVLGDLWEDSSPCTGLQVIALLGLLRLDGMGDTGMTAGERLYVGVMYNISSSSTSSQSEVPLINAYALLVGLSPTLITALTPGTGISAKWMPHLARCALLRSCLSVFDISALLFQPRRTQLPNERSNEEILAYLIQIASSTDLYQIQYVTMRGIGIIELEKLSALVLSDMMDSRSPDHASSSSQDLPTLHPLDTCGIFLGVAFDIICSLCYESISPTARLYGLQTLDTWLGRVEAENLCARIMSEDISTGERGGVTVRTRAIREALISRMYRISLLLTKTWSNPSRIVRNSIFNLT